MRQLTLMAFCHFSIDDKQGVGLSPIAHWQVRFMVDFECVADLLSFRFYIAVFGFEILCESGGLKVTFCHICAGSTKVEPRRALLQLLSWSVWRLYLADHGLVARVKRRASIIVLQWSDEIVAVHRQIELCNFVDLASSRRAPNMVTHHTASLRRFFIRQRAHGVP